MRTFVLVSAITVAVAAAPAVAAPPPPGALETIERVAPGVWSIHQREPFHLQPVGNVELIEQQRGLVMIDGGGSPGSARRIVRLIKSVSSKPVTAIAITHWHGDHSLGVATILRSWPNARVITTTATRSHIFGQSMERYPKGAPDAAKTKAFLDDNQPFLDSFRKSSANDKLPPGVRAGYAASVADLGLYRKDIEGVFLPTRIEGFATRRLLPDPVRPVELRFIGKGNTDGDLVAWLPRQRVLATGDLVVAPIPFGFGSYPASWQRDLETMIALKPRIIVPGHGLPMRNDSYLRLLRDMLRDLRDRMAVIGPSEDLERAKTDITPVFAGYQNRFAGDDPWLQSWFVKYWQNPFSELLWKESRGIPIEQGKG